MDADAEAQGTTKQERAVRGISRRSVQLAGPALLVVVMAPLVICG